MIAKPLAIALLAFAAGVSAQTITRSVTSSGRVVYSDTVPTDGDVSSSRTLSRGHSLALSEETMPSACRPDAHRFCVTQTGNDALKCLAGHRREISEACDDELDKRARSRRP